ncbi:unnamed protein product [Amoebophrya sp. A25]|nr:unnamed protein product [Amoebophrya sp. A25]|eukprot:GSA25T00009629001.1
MSAGVTDPASIAASINAEGHPLTAGAPGDYGLSAKEYEDIVKAFQVFDDSGDGLIDMDELEDVLRLLGQKPTRKELIAVMDALDQDKSGQIDFSEFLPFMAKVLKLQSERSIEGMLRRKNPHYVHGPEAEDRKVGDRRKIVNWVPFMLGTSLPWAVFAFFFWLNSFKYWKYPNWIWTIDMVTIFFGLYVLYRNKRRMQLPTTFFIAFMCWAYVPLAWLAGSLNFWSNLYPYYQLSQMAAYVSVNPSRLHVTSVSKDSVTGKPVYTTSQSSRPAEGKRYQDAGKVYFAGSSVTVDTTKVISFKNHDTYCAAPIVDSTCTEDCGNDFWAVGVNCCGEEGALKFNCDGFKTTFATESEEIAMSERERTGLRWIDDTTRQNFRLAVLEAEGIHKIKAAHPLFFSFYQDGRSPDGVLSAYAQAGLEVTLGLYFLVFCMNILIMMYLAKRLITTKAPTLDDF